MASIPPSVIIDIGSGRTKIGLSSDIQPLAIFSTVVGRPRPNLSPEVLADLVDPYYVGVEAQSRRPNLLIKYPVEFGIVTNWEDYSKIIRYAFDRKLCIDPSDQIAILSEAMLNPKANREKAMQIMFEDFVVPALYMGTSSHLSFLAGSPKSDTGLVLEVGDGVIHAVPIYEKNVLAFCVPRSHMTGRTVIDQFMRFSKSADFEFTTTSERNLLWPVMEEHSFVSLDYHSDMQRDESEFLRQIKLPGLPEFPISKSRFQCMESLFTPSLAGFEEQGLSELVLTAIKKCDPTIRNDIARNVIICGGFGSVPGFAKRIENDNMFEDYAIKVKVHPQPHYSAWLGGHQVANLPPEELAKLCVSKDEYDEFGPALVHRKFVCI
jgi:actin